MMIINNDFEQKMIELGYKIHKPNLSSNAVRLFQKKITNIKGIKYFINILHYNHSIKLIGAPDEDTYTAQVQLSFNDNSICDLSYRVNNNEEYSVVDIEEFFEKFWNTMSPLYYELN